MGGWVAGTTISKVDATSEAVIGSYTVGNAPGHMTYDSVNNAIWVINENDNTVSKVNAANGALIGTYSVVTAGNLSDIAYNSSSNTIWISDYNNSNVKVLNASTGSITQTISTSLPGGITYDNRRQSVFVMNLGDNSMTEFRGDAPGFDTGADQATGYTVTTKASASEISTTGWTALNSVAVTETKNSQTIFYALSFDAGRTYSIWTGGAWRKIASNLNSNTGVADGLWYYQNGATDLWAPAAVNNANSAISSAITGSGGAANSMTGTTLNALTSGNLSATGGWTSSVTAIDVAAFFSTTSGYQGPSLDNITFDYTQGSSVSFSSTSAGVAEGTSPMTISAILDTVSATDVTVHYTMTGTATMGTDYTAPSGVVTIPAGQISTLISVPIINDTMKEPNETIVMTMYNPTNATIGATPTFTYTIQDDDTVPTIGFSAGSSRVYEGTSSTQIPVILSAVSGQDISANYTVTAGTATGSGTDYTLASGAITIPKGATTGYITPQIADDAVTEGVETFTITLSAPTNATLSATTTNVVSIVDNEGVPAIGFSTDQLTVVEGSPISFSIVTSKNVASGERATATIHLSGGTAVNGRNFCTPEASPPCSGPTEGPMDVNAGTSSSNLSLASLADADSINQTLIATLDTPVNAVLGNITRMVITIREASVTSSTPTYGTVNGIPSPATVASGNPVFGWKFTPGASGDSQTAYQLVISSSASNLNAGTYDICDSTKITSIYSVTDYKTACGGTLSSSTIYWKVRTYNVAGTASSFSSNYTLSAGTGLREPSSCTISSITARTLTVGWTDNATGETGYEVEQSKETLQGDTIVSNGNWKKIQTTSANAISYDVTGLTPSSAYFFRVRAISNNDTSAYATCSMTVTIPVAPSAPVVTAISDTSIRVRISPVEDSNNYAIQVNSTSYVQANGTLGGGAVYQDIGSWGDMQGMVVTGLTPNTAYSVNILAQNMLNAGQISSSATVTYTLVQAPVVSTSSPNTTTFSTTIGTASNPSATLYAIQINDGTQTRYVQSNGSLANTLFRQTGNLWGTIAITGLTANTNYTIQDIAYNGDDLPVYSFVAAQKTNTGAPTSFRATSLTTLSVGLRVDTVTGATYIFNSGIESGATTATNAMTNNGLKQDQTATLHNGTTVTTTLPICSAVATPGAAALDSSQQTPTSAHITLGNSGNPASTEFLVQDIANNLYLSPLGVLTSTPTWATYADFGGGSGMNINGLSPGMDNLFQVKARNCQNIETAYSGTTRLTGHVNIPGISTLTITPDGDGKNMALVQINTNNSATYGVYYSIYDDTIGKYYIRSSDTLSSSITGSWDRYEDLGGDQGFLIRNLSPNVTHNFVIKAKSRDNSISNFSSVSSVILGTNKPLVASYNSAAQTITLQVNPMSNSLSTEYIIEKGSGEYLQSGGTNNTFGGTKSWATLASWDGYDGYDGSADGYITIASLTPNAISTLRLISRNRDQIEGRPSSAIVPATIVAAPSSVSATARSTTELGLSWAVNSNPAGTEYLITKASAGQYATGGHILSSTPTWSSWDNLTPTNSWYVGGLTAGTSYCFTVTARNTYGEEVAGVAEGCGTTTAETVSSSGGGGGGGGSTTPTNPVTPVEPPIRIPPPVITPTPNDPVVTPPVTPVEPPSRYLPPIPPPVITPTPNDPVVTPIPVNPTVTDNTGGGTGGGGGSGGGFINDLNNLKKQREEIDKQIKEQGYITFLDKKVEVPGAKSFVGITRDEFLSSLNSDVQYEKAYTTKTADAIKAEVTTTLHQQAAAANDTYIRTNEAYYAILAALNITEIESCNLRIFEKCDWSNDQNYLSIKMRDALFSNARNYLNDLLSKKTRTIDTDKDGLTDYEEIYLYSTNPKTSDTDDDNIFDGDEIKKYKTDALNADTDGDGLTDGSEVKKYKTSPLLIDTDNDGWTDKQEADAGTDPKNPLSHPEEKEAASGTKDTDGDGLSDLEERNIGTDPKNRDTDGDGASDGEELARGTNPLKFDAPNQAVETAIINIRSGMKFAESPLVRGSSKANGTVILYARNEIGLKKEVGRTEAASNNLFAFQLRPLPDGAYYIQAQDDQGGISKPVKITIDSTLKIPAPEITKFNDQEITAALIAKAKTDATYEPESDSRPTLEIRIPTGTKGIFTFKSAIGTAVLISDTPSGIVEVRPPEELELGEHEIIAYSVKEEDNTVSPIASFKFKVTAASNFDSSQFRIKNKDAGGLVNFLRQNSVKPLFTKIFIGISIVLLMWGLLSFYQQRRKK